MNIKKTLFKGIVSIVLSSLITAVLSGCAATALVLGAGALDLAAAAAVVNVL